MVSEEALEEIKQVSEMYPDGIHKISEAEKMFENLGYNKIVEGNTIRYTSMNWGNYKKIIDFDLCDRRINCDCVFNGLHSIFSISIFELEAINQQVKELGGCGHWNYG